MLSPDLKASERVHPEAGSQPHEDIDSFDHRLSSEAFAGVAPLLYRFSIQQYYQMAAAGIFSEQEEVELIEGLVIDRVPKNPPHAGFNDYIAELLRRYLPILWFVRVQNPIVLSDNAPEPDIAIVRGNAVDFLTRHPDLNEYGLIIEVAEATLNYDRATKAPLYARFNIPHYWILNLVERQLEVYTEPLGTSGYRTRSIYRPQDTVPFILDGQVITQIPVTEFFPEPTA